MAFKDPIPPEIREKDARGELSREEWNFWNKKMIDMDIRKYRWEAIKMIFYVLGSLALMFVPAFIPPFFALLFPSFLGIAVLGAFNAFCVGVMAWALFHAPHNGGFRSSEFG